ncbi:MAG: diacylglycerol kinase family protein [Planctomycetota bacterium]|nr:diacylglycerol kinase family protein [Planctomycetota bacterium]
MKVILFYNPRSGSGAAARAADALDAALRPRGVECAMVEAFNGSTSAVLSGPLAWADALVVLGGDGTVQSAAECAVERGVPLYHVPMGTENLFARQFGMRREAEAVYAALRSGRTTGVDVARCNGRSFVLMCSAGPDASVIHRLSRVRTGAISHLSYIRPVLAEAFDPALRRVRITVDGRTVVDGRRGMVIVANSRQYALRADPARRAVMDDGKLDVVFFPAWTSLGAAGWLLSARLGVHRVRGGWVYESGRDVRIEGLSGGVPVQLDGEAAEASAERVDVRVDPGKLRVLLPG